MPRTDCAEVTRIIDQAPHIRLKIGTSEPFPSTDLECDLGSGSQQFKEVFVTFYACKNCIENLKRNPDLTSDERTMLSESSTIVVTGKCNQRTADCISETKEPVFSLPSEVFIVCNKCFARIQAQLQSR